MARLLVVEDDVVLRRTLTAALTFDGHDVAYAANGYEAHRALSGPAFDVVVTDVLMPDMDGVELVRDIRARTPAPAVIAISRADHAGASEGIEMARQLGVSATLEKPFTLERFRATLKQVLPKA